MTHCQDISSELDKRRKELGMSICALARLSGLNRNTVSRVLVGGSCDERLSTLRAIGEILGISVGLVRPRRISAVRRDRAEAKAAELVEMAQGNFALEGQAVSEKEEKRIVQQVAEQLLNSKSIRLWA